MNAPATKLPAEQKVQTPAAAPKTVKDWMSSPEFAAQIRAALPQHITAERFVRVALTALMKTPKLAQCSQDSIFKAMLDCSSLGLEPDGRRVHLIPFDVKDRETGRVVRTDVQLIIDYKGLIELAKRSGEVKKWRAELVCENDTFEYRNGAVTIHEIDWRKDRGKPYAVYSYVKNKDDEEDYEVMSYHEVEKIRKRSKAGNNGPWVSDYDEMAKKTVMRRHSKRLTLSPEYMDALDKDDDRYEDLPVTPSDYSVMPRRIGEPAPEGELPPPASEGEPKAESPAGKPAADALITPEQARRLWQMAEKGGIAEDDLRYHLGTRYSAKDPSKLKVSEYDKVCRWIEMGGDEPGANG